MASSKSPFLGLPAELRNTIYEYISLNAGVYVESRWVAVLRSPTTMLQLCRQVKQEYESVLYTTAPLITAISKDFDFSALTTFLDRQSGVQKTSHDDCASRPRIKRQLDIVLDLSMRSPRRLNHLKIWLESIAYSDDSLFATHYVLRNMPGPDELCSAEQFLMVNKLLDTIYGEWFISMPPGRVKAEIGKVCDCLGRLEGKVAPVRW